METRPLKGFENFYTIREDGLITSIPRTHETVNRFGPMTRKCGGKIMKTHINGFYKMVELNANKKIKKYLVHRLVYSTFVGDLIKGMAVHHKDGNKINNHFKNLEQIDYITHNNIHSHVPWNKGLKRDKEFIDKCRTSRLNHFIPIFEETYLLRKNGMTNSEIANKLRISDRTVIERIKRYKELIHI